MSPELRSLLYHSIERNRTAVSGAVSTAREDKAKELIFAHATALNELKEKFTDSPAAAYLGARRHLETIAKTGITTAHFHELHEKHFLASTQKLAEELLARSKELLPESDRDEINDALKLEHRLHDAQQARAILKKLTDTEVGRIASATPLGSKDAEEEDANALGGGVGCLGILIGGGVGLLLFGLWGAVIVGGLGALLVGMIATGGGDKNRAEIVKMHKEVKAHEPLFRAVGVSSESALKCPLETLITIENKRREAQAIIAKHAKMD